MSKVNWRELKTDGRIEAIRSVWAPKHSARLIAERLGVTRMVVAGMYHRYPEQLADCPLQGEMGRWRKGKARRWTEAEHEIVARMMREHKSADAIALAIGAGVSGDMVLSLVRRTPELKAIGWTARAANLLSEEERSRRRREADRRYRMKSARPLPANQSRKPFKPVIVSNNVGMMVQDFIAKNGVRRFERNASSDYHSIALYLQERGWRLTTKQGANYKLEGPNGRVRSISWRDAVAVADRFRMAEGLEPFLAA